MDFKIFKVAVANQFKHMAETGKLFRTAAIKDEVWQTYLDAFPEGTNPIYRERREYDCNCCKNFIRNVGNVVSFIDDKIVSVWDIKVSEPAFQVVADKLAKMVKGYGIEERFLHFERQAGTDRTLVDTLDGVTSWQHFFVNIPAGFVKPKDDIPSALGEIRARFDVLKRSLDTIHIDAVDTVLDLISQNALYRGEEHKATLAAFRKLQIEYRDLSPDVDNRTFVWSRVESTPGAVSKIRNTSIGTLLVDLSEGKDLEDAVKAFEAMVAPTNYKRPTALVTKSMIENAKKAIAELGLTSALERRYALPEDISINNVLFADAGARRSMKGDAFDDLMAAVAEKPKLDKVEDVHIDKFIEEILPRVQTVELMFENRHAGNLVSLIAPVDPTAPSLFKWDNKFSWSYQGEVADSIKERVKKAGGNVTGDLCFRLGWFNHDDLDLHMLEPDGNEVYFGTRGHESLCGGKLDVDMNAFTGLTRTPVENIFYKSKRAMRDGLYRLFVHNYNCRETSEVGFEVEMQWEGQTTTFAYAQPVRNNEKVTVIEFRYSAKEGIKVVNSLPSTSASRVVWGMPTQTYRPVSMVMLSPNYWDGQGVGNKHWFFMLQGCVGESARGFYNEFLSNELNAQRKVLEMVGSKMKAEKSDRQLSGLGFSSTQRSSVLCRVKGSFSRVINLVF